jgi:hypothetical protein
MQGFYKMISRLQCFVTPHPDPAIERNHRSTALTFQRVSILSGSLKFDDINTKDEMPNSIAEKKIKPGLPLHVERERG